MAWALIGVVVVLVCAVIALVIRGRRARAGALQRDDTLRAGEADSVDQHDAASRASGSAAWMRPGGGGI